MQSLIGNYREVANPDKLDLKDVDPDEVARIRKICDAIFTKFVSKDNTDVKIRGIDSYLQTKLSIQGWNDHVSMVDWCNTFHNDTNNNEKNKKDNNKESIFPTITDSLVNPITGEINLFINKESPNAIRRAQEGTVAKIKTHHPGSNGKIALFADDDDDDAVEVKREQQPPKRRPYIPRK